MSLVRWNPGKELFSIQNDMNRFMDRFFSPDLFDQDSFGWVPSMDVSEDQDGFLMNMELPGLKKDDVNITLTDGLLTIEGERKSEIEKKDVNVHRVERRYGKFRRTFKLPVAVKGDKIDATFKDGLLTINIPKAEVAKPKQIDVKIS